MHGMNVGMETSDVGPWQTHKGGKKFLSFMWDLHKCYIILNIIFNGF